MIEKLKTAAIWLLFLVVGTALFYTFSQVMDHLLQEPRPSPSQTVPPSLTVPKSKPCQNLSYNPHTNAYECIDDRK